MYVAVDAPALAHGVLYRGEVIVEQNHICRLFGYVRARYAHCNAYICLFEGGTIVYAVARHCRNFARALERFYYAQLIRRRNARKHHTFFHRLVELFVRHFVQLRACDYCIALSEYVQLFCYGERRNLVVARYHYYAYARFVAGLYRAYYFLSRRVYHAHCTDESHPELHVGRFVLGHFIQPAFGKAEHAERLVRHLVAQL